MSTHNMDFREKKCDKIRGAVIQGSVIEDKDPVAGKTFNTRIFYGPKVKHHELRQNTQANSESVSDDTVPIIDMSSDVIITLNNRSDSSIEKSVIDKEKHRGCRKILFKSISNHDDNDQCITSGIGYIIRHFFGFASRHFFIPGAGD